MAKILKQNVVLRRAISEAPVTFLKGEVLPEEYEHLVGDHLLTEGAAPKKKGNTAPLPSETLAPSPEEEGLTVPGRNASKATWVKFAEANNITIPSNAGRDDIIEIVEQALPELEI